MIYELCWWRHGKCKQTSLISNVCTSRKRDIFFFYRQALCTSEDDINNRNQQQQSWTWLLLFFFFSQNNSSISYKLRVHFNLEFNAKINLSIVNGSMAGNCSKRKYFFINTRGSFNLDVLESRERKREGKYCSFNCFTLRILLMNNTTNSDLWLVCIVMETSGKWSNFLCIIEW